MTPALAPKSHVAVVQYPFYLRLYLSLPAIGDVAPIRRIRPCAGARKASNGRWGRVILRVSVLGREASTGVSLSELV